jgi:chaperonin GroEL
MLEDIAAVTGAVLVSEQRGDDLGTIDPVVLGGAERIKLTKNATTIVGGTGNAADIARRAAGIRAQQELAGNTPFQEKNLRERLAKLTGGVAVIRVGGASETEIGERQDRADDAASAVRAAASDGILPGGGVAYIHAVRRLQSGRSAAERAATGILRHALSAPAIRIADNAGYDGRAIVAKLAASSSASYGFDAQSATFGDLTKAGIVDPAGVVVSALEAANSVASLLLTAEVVIARPPPSSRPTRADDMPFGPEAKDMTADEAGGFGLV